MYIVLFIGVKGLNIVVLDVYYLYYVLIVFYNFGLMEGIEGYFVKVFVWVWKVEWFSWWFLFFMY